MAKEWTIPTVLRELRRVTLEMSQQASDIMKGTAYTVDELVADLTKFHMNKEMEIPGQTTIPVPEYTEENKGE